MSGLQCSFAHILCLIKNTRSQRLEQRRPTELRFKASLSCRREQHLCLSARLPPRIPVKALKPELCGELIAGPRNQELNDTKKESGERKLREREKGGKSVQEDSFLLTHSGNPAALHPRFQVNEPLRSRPRVWEPGLGCECNAAKVALSTLSVSLFFSDPAMTAKCSKTSDSFDSTQKRVWMIQRDRATQHFNIPNNVRETGRLFKEYHIKRVGMSAEGYAYIFPVLPIQEEQGALMSGRRYCFDQDYK
ncbi:hypothetical protein JOQ06_004445, partial [Pogonophryne albipinna]